MLREKGHRVIVVSRTAGKEKLTWDDVKKNGLPSGCTAVVNLAGRLILEPFKRLDEKYLKELHDSRIDTSKLLVSAITSANVPPKVFVTISGVGYYPPSPTATYTEDGVNGSDWLAKLAKEWEAAGVLPEHVTTRRVIVRSGVVLGADGGMIKTLLPVPAAVYLPMLQLGSGKQWFPWIHVKDIAGIITHAIEKEHMKGVLNGVAPHAINNKDFTEAFNKAFKKMSYGPMFVPAFTLNMVYGSEMAKIVLEGQKVVPERTLEAGYEYFYPSINDSMKEISAKF
ncbi:epimerase family protein SDR39U1-like isoform X2 [Dreissena polymorpha]|nr:epimerase family protein SDR39U1-like isoform X2 [Dreissena polymorpha]